MAVFLYCDKYSFGTDLLAMGGYRLSSTGYIDCSISMISDFTLSMISGWNWWMKFVVLFETNTRMTMVPQYYKDEETTLSFGVSCITSFMCFLFDVKHLAPSTVMGYLAGDRFYLASLDVDTSFADTSLVIKRVRAGIWNTYRRKHPVADTRKLPLSCDMVDHGMTNVFNSSDLRGHAMRTVLCCARFCFVIKGIRVCCVQRIVHTS